MDNKQLQSQLQLLRNSNYGVVSPKNVKIDPIPEHLLKLKYEDVKDEYSVGFSQTHEQWVNSIIERSISDCVFNENVEAEFELFIKRFRKYLIGIRSGSCDVAISFARLQRLLNFTESVGFDVLVEKLNFAFSNGAKFSKKVVIRNIKRIPSTIKETDFFVVSVEVGCNNDLLM